MYFVLSTWVVSIKRELRVAPKYSTQLNSTLIVSRCRLMHCHWRPRLPQRPLPPKKDILFNKMFLVYWFHWFLVAMHGMVEWVKRIGLAFTACLRLGGGHSWSQMITRFCKLKCSTFTRLHVEHNTECEWVSECAIFKSWPFMWTFSAYRRAYALKRGRRYLRGKGVIPPPPLPHLSLSKYSQYNQSGNS